jgi:hypothetical protein
LLYSLEEFLNKKGLDIKTFVSTMDNSQYFELNQNVFSVEQFEKHFPPNKWIIKAFLWSKHNAEKFDIDINNRSDLFWRDLDAAWKEFCMYLLNKDCKITFYNLKKIKNIEINFE